MAQPLQKHEEYLLHGIFVARLITMEKFARELRQLADREKEAEQKLLNAISDKRMRTWIENQDTIRHLFDYGHCSDKIHCGDELGDRKSIRAAFRKLQKEWGANVKITTRGEDGDTREEVDIRIVRL